MLAAEATSVLATGRTAAKLDAARRSLGGDAERVAFLAGDNADDRLPHRLRKAVPSRWGRLDGLLVSVGGPPAGRALVTDDATWRQAFETVFLGTVRLVRDPSPAIGDGGAIVLAVSAREVAPTPSVSRSSVPGTSG